MASVKLIITVMEYFGFTDERAQSESMNYILMTREVVSYLFRVFDSNGNGTIEASELLPIIRAWLIAFLNLGTDLVIAFEDLLNSMQAQTLIGDVVSCVLGMPDGYDTKVTVDEAAQKMLPFTSDAFDILQTILMGISSSLEMLSSGFLAELFQSSVSERVFKLLQSLREVSVNGRLSIKQCVNQAAPVLAAIAEDCLARDVIARAVDAEVLWLNRQLNKYSGKQSVSIPREVIEAAICSIANDLRNVVRQDVSSQLVKTVLDFVDVDGDGELSESELANLIENIKQLAEVRLFLPKLFPITQFTLLFALF
jgi:Ca2+-binding EF-hand superfamily protein